MTEKILINIAPHEVRVAFIEQEQLREIYVEGMNHPRFLGNIYRGKVVRVLPGMQAAFVDIGLARTGFLHARDVWSFSARSQETKMQTMPAINHLLSEGQELLVQVTKEPFQEKGACLTTHIKLSSRYLVFTANRPSVDISQLIVNPKERERLQMLVRESTLNKQHGYIIRTAAENVSAKDIQADMRYLEGAWQTIQQWRGSATSLIYEELPLAWRLLRNARSEKLQKIYIDEENAYHKLCSFVLQYVPELSNKIELYNEKPALFDAYQIEEAIQKALDRKVNLASGGYLMIDQTEAMTTIDVNTGKFVGHRDLAQTLLKTNLEAVVALAREIRLRNLSGMIIVDFISMTDDGHKQEVLKALEEALANDPVKTRAVMLSSESIVHITRKRAHQSLWQVLCEPCKTCQGRRFLKTTETIASEIFREILQANKIASTEKILILAAHDVVDYLTTQSSAFMENIQHMLNQSIACEVIASDDSEHYEIVFS